MTSQQQTKRPPSEHFENAGKRVDRTVTQAAERLDQKCEKLIAYLNDDVIPAVRHQSSRGLRRAADKLSEFAEYLESRPRS